MQAAIPTGPFVVFDYEGEYQKFLTDQAGRDEEDLIYLCSREASHTWSLFVENLPQAFDLIEEELQ